jgi:hypothetical protein
MNDQNKIISYTVRRPGCVAWTQGLKTRAAAAKEAQRAEQVTGQRHAVYGEHADGSTSYE